MRNAVSRMALMLALAATSGAHAASFEYNNPSPFDPSKPDDPVVWAVDVNHGIDSGTWGPPVALDDVVDHTAEVDKLLGLVDVVKIDRSFVHAMVDPTQPDAPSHATVQNIDVCRAIVHMCHELGMAVVAEGADRRRGERPRGAPRTLAADDPDAYHRLRGRSPAAPHRGTAAHPGRTRRSDARATADAGRA